MEAFPSPTIINIANHPSSPHQCKQTSAKLASYLPKDNSHLSSTPLTTLRIANPKRQRHLTPSLTTPLHSAQSLSLPHIYSLFVQMNVQSCLSKHVVSGNILMPSHCITTTIHHPASSHASRLTATTTRS